MSTSPLQEEMRLKLPGATHVVAAVIDLTASNSVPIVGSESASTKWQAGVDSMVVIASIEPTQKSASPKKVFDFSRWTQVASS